MKTLRLIVFAVLITSCGVTVNYDYEKSTDFNKYKTYNYYSDAKTGLSELDTKRLLNILDESFQGNGFTLSETPDFYVDIKSRKHQNQNNNTVGVGVGGSGRNVGGGISVGIPIGQAKLSRQISFDFIDAETNTLFWQAVSESNYKENTTPEKREENLKAIVVKVLEGYPPKK